MAMITVARLAVLCTLLSYAFADFAFHTSWISPNNQRPIRVRSKDELDRRSQNEDVILNFVGMVEQHAGYTAEEYHVTSEDGYILAVHRITGSPQSPKAANKPVAYVGHGLFGSSEFMTVLGPNNALPYVLADAGYDVWQGNVRGNSVSRSHIEHKPESGTFWDFSLDDMASKDLSKMIDFALEKSGQRKLTYIGYSMGTILSYMLLSEKPEYNEKINLLISLGSSVYFLHSYSFKNLKLRGLVKGFLFIAKLDWTYEILPASVSLTRWVKENCNTAEESACSDYLTGFTDIHSMNLANIPAIIDYSPAGTSYKTVEHFDQLIAANGKLLKYDYGCASTMFYCANSNYYTTSTPPEYDISKVSVPVVILHAKDDFFVSDEEAEFLRDKLSNVVFYERIEEAKFNHMDFVWSTKAKTLIYDKLVKIMSQQLHSNER